MASYNELNALIDAYINRNGVQAITGQILNGVLKAMVEQLGRGYTIMGAAIPTTDPGTPDGPECYFASETGTYTDFDGLQVAPGELALLCYTPSDGWTKATIYEGFQEVGATIDGNVGTPSVGVSYANGVLSFDFHNMKGNPGDAAGFGTIGADITGGVGTPGVTVESSGPATAKNLQFHFTNLKGETGVTSVVATVDNTTGTPACTVSLEGQQLTLAFSGLKGAQGDTGSSVDYPFTIVNNLTTNDATQALSAAQGKVLKDELTQLEAELYGEPSVTYIDVTTIWTPQLNKALGNDGKISSNAGYDVYVVPCSGCTHISGTASAYTNNAMVAFYNGEPGAATFISALSATKNKQDEAFDSDIPTGAVYVAIECSHSASTPTGTLTKPTGGRGGDIGQLQDAVQDLSEDVSSLSGLADDLADLSEDVSSLDDCFAEMVGQYLPHLWNPVAWGEVVSGKYWNLVDGEAGLVSSAGYYARQNLLPVNPGQRIKVTVKDAIIDNGTYAVFAGYDNNGLPAYDSGTKARVNFMDKDSVVSNGDGTSTYTFTLGNAVTQIGLFYKTEEVTFYIEQVEQVDYSERLDQHIQDVAGGGATTSGNSARYYLKGESPKSFSKKICILAAGQSNIDGRDDYADMPAEIQSAQPITNCLYVKNSESGAFAPLNIDGQWAFDLVTYYNIALNQDLYVIKWSEGGTSIDPLGDGTNHWTADYEELSSLSKSLLLKFEREIRNHIASDGSQFDVRAMLWHQGEGDRGSLGTGSADRYYNNLRNMLSYIRGIVGNERLPIITGTISENSAQYDATIHSAQERLASEDPYFVLIDMSGAPLKDSYHFNAAASVYLGQMAYNALIDLGVISGTKLTPTRPW